MRTYTNFDLWKYHVHHRGIGKIEYMGKSVDLDDQAAILTLLIELHLDQIVTITRRGISASEQQGKDVAGGLKIRLNDPFQRMNILPDGQENDMQLGAVMLNLVEAGVLKRVSR
jgi:hypothetical protein